MVNFGGKTIYNIVQHKIFILLFYLFIIILCYVILICGFSTTGQKASKNLRKRVLSHGSW